MSTTAAPTPFIEEEPLHLDVAIAPVAADGPKVTDLDAQQRQQAKPRWTGLPTTGPGIVRVIPVGSRLILRPSDQRAAEALEHARVQLGFHWDSKQQRHINHLDTFTRRGVSQFDSIRLIGELMGLHFEMVDGAEKAIGRYGARLERQLRPIPRHTWLDEIDHADREDDQVAASFSASAYRRWS